MKIHEYQAKELLAKHGVPISPGILAYSGEEAAKAYNELGCELVVVKAQVHAGGRGKGGGVKLARSAAEAQEKATVMMQKPLVTHQTGPAGRKVRKVLIAKGVDIAKEYYLGLVVDRNRQCPVLMASAEGGVEIEEVAKNSPEKIMYQPIGVHGLLPYQVRQVCFNLGLDPSLHEQAAKLLNGLVATFLAEDCSLAEINPMVVTKDNQVLAIDAKINLDDNAAYRHPEWQQMRDEDEEDPTELEASRHSLSYIKLDGSIGCMVNGAGLAMATMDIIQEVGGSPANFLDVGGGTSTERVTVAFKIILSDPNVKAILVNIFGGIVKCDVIAQGIVTAVKEMQLQVPLVVRLEGTNVEIGKEILKNSGLNIIAADKMKEAAQKAVAAAAGKEVAS